MFRFPIRLLFAVCQTDDNDGEKGGGCGGLRPITYSSNNYSSRTPLGWKQAAAGRELYGDNKERTLFYMMTSVVSGLYAFTVFSPIFRYLCIVLLFCLFFVQLKYINCGKMTSLIQSNRIFSSDGNGMLLKCRTRIAVKPRNSC